MWRRSPVFTLGIIIALGLLAPDKSYSIYNSEVAWELVIISSKPACSGYHYYMMEKYQDISERYLELYQLQNKGYSPQCMTELEFLRGYSKPHDLDLLILVYDRELGRTDLHSQNTGGIYLHQGDDLSRNHTIIFCDCSNFEYSDPVWILSHELSHFVLNYLGFNLDIVEDEIHKLDQKFDFCVEYDYDDTCSSVKTRIETELGLWVVMAPYEDAIGKSIPDPSSEKAAFDSPFQAKMVMEVTNWWLAGDVSNENYVNSLKILSGEKIGEDIKTNGILAEPPMIALSEPPTWKKGQQINESPSQVAEYLLAMSPFIEEGKEILSTEEEEIFILWLKTKAQSWSAALITEEEFLKDLEYLLNSPKTGLYLNYLNSLSTNELIEKGIEFQKAGEYRNALSYFDRALIKSLDSEEIKIEPLLLKGSALNGLGQYEEALIYFDNALDVEPENFEALRKMAFTLAQLGQLEEAKHYFELAHQIETN